MRWLLIPGSIGRIMEATKRLSACPADKADGAREKTYRGSRCGPSWWLKWRTTTCRETASVIRRNSAGGVTTRSQPTALTPNSKWCLRRNWLRFSLAADKAVDHLVQVLSS